MSIFITMVQTGLLANAASKNPKKYNKKFHSMNQFPSIQYMNAMEDAFQLDNPMTFGKASNAAKNFVCWVLYGTEYEWIKEYLGKRKDCEY